MSMIDDDGMPPIEGEIVGPVPLIEGERDDRRRERRYHDEDTIAQAIRARALGFSLQEIAGQLDVSHESVRRWCGEANKSRQYGRADLPKVRAAMAVELEAAEHEALRVVRTYPGTELALKALNTFNQLIRTRANLVGAVAPVKIDVDVKETTAVDAELQEMVAAARQASQTQIDKIREGFEDGRR